MKKLETTQLEQLLGGNMDAACGFALGMATVAAVTTAPVAFATWGFIGALAITACGGSISQRIYL